MIILDYTPKKHRQIIHACVSALRDGNTVIFPTETSYGLGCDVTNPRAVRRLYLIKGRDFNKPVHVVIPSLRYPKTVGEWNRVAQTLARAFWPGSLSLVLPLTSTDNYLKKIGGGTNTVGVRLPNNAVARDLARVLGKPVSATSANRSGQPDCYSLEDILSNFGDQKYKPDIIINAGRLPKRKPSTVVKIVGDGIEILRPGPISEKQIVKILRDA